MLANEFYIIYRLFCLFILFMLMLKLQYFGYLMQRTDSLEKTRCWERLKAGGEGDNRGWDGWMASPTLWTWVWVSSGNWWWTGKPGVLQSMGSQRVGHDWTTQLNWICRLFARKNNFSTICLIYAAQRTWELSEKFLLEKKGIIDNLSVC